MIKLKIIGIRQMLAIKGLARADVVQPALAIQSVKNPHPESEKAFQNFTSGGGHDFTLIIFLVGVIFAFGSTLYLVGCKALNLGKASSRSVDSHHIGEENKPELIEDTTFSSKQITSTTYVEKAYTSFRQGDAQRAISELNNAISVNPRDANLYTERANFRRRNLGDQQGALEDYTQAISLHPENALYYLWRSQLYHEIGDKLKAMTDYNTAIRLAPEDTMYHFFNKV